MTPRARLGPHDLFDLHTRIDRMLDESGVETQPRVALRLIELAGDSNAQLKDYAEIVKADAALTGRILRLANSAFYAQRTEVTRLDRALVLLGVERTKAITLGFYISRSLMSAGSRELSRRVWGQSLYRASLASALAKMECPALAPEAYIIGLMLDAGVPLMARYLGESYVRLVEETPSPVAMYAKELQSLEFTHVDVAEALMRRWRMPAMLAKPIMWHHTPPSVDKAGDSLGQLHRVAYFAGAVQLGDGYVPETRNHLPTMAGRLFEMAPSGLDSVVAGASREYAATIGVFANESPPGSTESEAERLETVSDAVHCQLVEIMDEQFGRSTRIEARGGPEKLVIDGLLFDIEPSRDGEVVTYISSLAGERLMSCVVRPQQESAATIKRLLGLEEVDDEEVDNLVKVMRGMAA
ncbi:MAG TPA: HDOD domain-containing protein [Phycisphaerales bacterium]|nr:HDOD domain-containing protein [Phycisphaerales bacterium]